MREAVALVVSLILLGPSLVGAESLGDVAAREKKKREGKPATGKVITEADLGKSGRGNYNDPEDTSAASVPPPGGGTGDKAAAAGDKKEKEKTPDEIRADEEKAWRDKMTAKNDEITRIRSRISLFESGSSYANAGAAAELDKLRNELKAAEAALQDLETQRQRSGYKR